MKVKISSKDVLKAIGKAAALTGSPEHMNLEAYDADGPVYVVASGNDTTIKVLCENSTAAKAGWFTFGQQIFSGILKNRGELELDCDGKADLSFKAVKGRYKGNVVVPPRTQIEMSVEGKSKKIKLTKAVQVALQSAVNYVSLTNIYTDQPMYLWLVSGKKGGLDILCYDEVHMAHYHHPEIELGKKTLSLPLQVFKSINALAEGEAYDLSLTDSTIAAKNATFEISMPLAQASDMEGVDEALNFLSGLKKADGWFVVENEKLQTILGNITSIHEGKNTPMTIKSKGGKITLGIETNYGKISEILKSKSKWPSGLSTNFDPDLLVDILSPIKAKEFKINLIKDQSLFVRVEEGAIVTTYCCAVF